MAPVSITESTHTRTLPASATLEPAYSHFLQCYKRCVWPDAYAMILTTSWLMYVRSLGLVRSHDYTSGFDGVGMVIM